MKWFIIDKYHKFTSIAELHINKYLYHYCGFTDEMESKYFLMRELFDEFYGKSNKSWATQCLVKFVHIVAKEKILRVFLSIVCTKII